MPKKRENSGRTDAKTSRKRRWEGHLIIISRVFSFFLVGEEEEDDEGGDENDDGDEDGDEGDFLEFSHLFWPFCYFSRFFSFIFRLFVLDAGDDDGDGDDDDDAVLCSSLRIAGILA